jgi:hypothetical protein
VSGFVRREFFFERRGERVEEDNRSPTWVYDGRSVIVARPARLNLSVWFISYGIVFFSHNKSANRTYQSSEQGMQRRGHGRRARRTWARPLGEAPSVVDAGRASSPFAQRRKIGDSGCCWERDLVLVFI